MNLKVSSNAVVFGQSNVVKTNTKAPLELLLEKKIYWTYVQKSYIPKKHHNCFRSLPVASSEINLDTPQLLDEDN